MNSYKRQSLRSPEFYKMFRNMWGLMHRVVFEKKKDFLFWLALHSEIISEKRLPPLLSLP